MTEQVSVAQCCERSTRLRRAQCHLSSAANWTGNEPIETSHFEKRTERIRTAQISVSCKKRCGEHDARPKIEKLQAQIITCDATRNQSDATTTVRYIVQIRASYDGKNVSPNGTYMCMYVSIRVCYGKDKRRCAANIRTYA